MQIFIQPRDVLLFRDGRPFTAGEDHRAVSLFPPTPQTMQGAIRSARLAQSGASFDHKQWSPEISDEIGDHSKFGALQMRGPFIAREEQGRIVRYFPLPADVALDECDHPIALAPLPLDENGFECNWPAKAQAISNLRPLWRRSVGRIEEARGWLSEEELPSYLDLQPFAITEERELFERESRFHVGIDSGRKRPQQGDGGGNLFQIEFVRVNDSVGLWLELSGVKLNEAGMLQLGGESKAAAYRKLADSSPSLKTMKARGRFKLYFATPAYFKNGWQPEDWSGFITGGEVKLVAAAVRRALTLGGFDLAQQRHKPMRRYAPAGSVYFFESEDEVTVPEIITEEGGQIGFGQVFIGRWDYV